MMPPLDCPGAEGWQSLLDLDVEPEQLSHFERHLPSCPACQDRLDRAEADEEHFRQRARRVGDPTAAPVDPTLSDFLERLQEGEELARNSSTDPAELYFLRPSDRPDLLGTLGVYEVREVIGQGGMGVVLKAYEPALHRLVAIKVLAPSLAESPTARRRFTREAQAAAAVVHDHIVTVHGVHETDGLPYLVMQYVAGESLQERLDLVGPLDVTDTVRIALQTASGLAAAHAQGLVHRDIKPANLLLEDGLARVRITDFGLARSIDDVGLTQTGVVPGTPEYMSPEQARGEPLDHRTDLFSLGSVLYAMCAGEAPFQGASTVAVLRKVSDAEPPPLRTLNPATPDWLIQLIALLLAKAPADRIQSAAEAAALLEGYLAHLHQPGTVPPPELRPLPPQACAGPPSSRSPRRLAAWLRPPWSAALVALAALGLGLLAFGAGGADAKPGELHDVLFHDFRHPPTPPSFSFWGDPRGKFLKAEPEGMRVTLPATYIHPFGGVGYLIAQGFEGDFEVTTTVEVLHADRPPPTGSGYGVGVILAVNKGDPTHGEWTSLGRQQRAQNGDVLYCYRYYGGFDGDEEPCMDRVGKLRLKRTGTTLSYLWAPGLKGEAFRTIRQCDFGPEPIQSVRLAAVTGREPCRVDVRLIDVQIRSGPASIVAKSWLARPFVVVGFSLVLLSALGVLLQMCRRTRLFASPGARGSREGGEEKPGSASPEAAMPSLPFPCPGCGKNLRVRAALAGKSVKCPACGQVVLTPETDPGSLAPRVSTGRFSILQKRGVVASVLVLAIVAGVCSWQCGPWRDRYWYLNATLGNQFVPEVQESGFYYQEYNKAGEPFRWTNGKARLVIPIDRRKPPSGLLVKLAIYRPAQVKAAWVQIVANNRELTKQHIPLWNWEGSSAGRFPAMPLDLTGVDLGDELVLDIISDTFVPPTDRRTLGVVVRGVELRHEAPAPQ